METNTQIQLLRRYHKEELELMTTYHLREICRTEKIIRGIINPLDKDELIHTIMKYHGERETQIIDKENPEGRNRLQEFFQNVRLKDEGTQIFQISSKITVYDGLSLGYHDQITIPYQTEYSGTNAVILSDNMDICGIFYLNPYGNQRTYLYLFKGENIVCQESSRRKYEICFFKQRESDILYQQYHGNLNILPSSIKVIRVPLLDFEVVNPMPLRLPVAIDFGSTNTTVGVFINNSIQYTSFYNRLTENGRIEERRLLPSAAGILSIKEGRPEYVFGYDAVRLANLSYVDEGFCVFYDIKRWIIDYEKEEEIVDRQGRRTFIKRKEIIKEFFLYLIKETENHFKCIIKQIHISCPVKQKYLFAKLFADIMPDYILPFDEMVDEGVSVLYNIISNMIEGKKLQESYPYQALIVDCGGGTTDLCACRFTIQDKKISYRIDIETAYENGDTDFGGNNLTYRIMQYIKIRLTQALGYENTFKAETIIAGLDRDIFRYMDDQTREGKNPVESLYSQLEEAYDSAEACLPTRFKDYEQQSRNDYYKVKNNYYFLFFLAEQVKKRFYEKAGVLKVIVTSEEQTLLEGIEWVSADKWKMSIWQKNELQVVKDFPTLKLDLFTIDLLLKGDIYGVIKKFMNPMYEKDEIRRISFLRLTGQSCKIDIFREALKEFVPGKMIQYKRKVNELSGETELKMTCVDGALKYMRDKRMGYTDVVIHTSKPILPYTITAFTHNGNEVELVNGFFREDNTKTISRNLDYVTLQLFLKDMDDKVRYSFYYDCIPDTFKQVTYEEIEEMYGTHILQKETDNIENQEIKFFVWKKFEEWGYVIVSIYRKNEILHIGKEEYYPFENEGWIQNFFDGLK